VRVLDHALAGSSMRRSRALSLFGWFLTMLAVATVTARSHAADRSRSRFVQPLSSAAVDSSPRLLPQPWKTDAPLLGSFAKVGPAPAVLQTATACPPEMVEIDGDYCPYVEQKCVRWLDPATHLQCAEFDKLANSGKCAMKTEHKHFCVDRYEWPNKAGAMPVSMASWNDAKASCDALGKRLCSDTEWTLSCEGQDHRPYPYGEGYARDDQACNIDKPYILPDAVKIFDPKTAAGELARLDQREPSGSRNSCVSPYGVHDMVGNVDEWVVNVSQAGKPFQSGLKGGYWGPVRTRCRPMTTAHDEKFRYYQIGFRCCGEAHAVEPLEAPMASR
jgi:sulfatase modifying factor 1